MEGACLLELIVPMQQRWLVNIQSYAVEISNKLAVILAGDLTVLAPLARAGYRGLDVARPIVHFGGL